MTPLDNLLVGWMESFLDFIEEWLYVSQASFERAMIVVFCVGSLRDLMQERVFHNLFDPLWLRVISIVGLLLYMVLLRTASAKERQRERDKGRLYRLLMFSTSAFMLLVFVIPPIEFQFFPVVTQGCSCSAFLYSVVSHTQGERGRKARLALAKLRELFGPLWTPAPEGGQ